MSVDVRETGPLSPDSRFVGPDSSEKLRASPAGASRDAGAESRRFHPHLNILSASELFDQTGKLFHIFPATSTKSAVVVRKNFVPVVSSSVLPGAKAARGRGAFLELS